MIDQLIVAESEEYVENQFGDPDSSVEASLFDTCVAMHHDVLSRLRAIINTETVSALMSIELECVEKEMLPPRMHLGRSMERWDKDIERYEKYWAGIVSSILISLPPLLRLEHGSYLLIMFTETTSRRRQC